MVEAPKHRILYPTSISYKYRAVWHLVMLWMGIWVHPDTGRPVQVVEDFRENWGMADPELCSNVMDEEAPKHCKHPISISYIYRLV
jgi:hypothetical protein